MSDLLRVHDFVKLAAKYGFDMWYDPSLRLWTLVDTNNEVVDRFTRTVLRNMGIKRFAEVFLGVKDGHL